MGNFDLGGPGVARAQDSKKTAFPGRRWFYCAAGNQVRVQMGPQHLPGRAAVTKHLQTHCPSRHAKAPSAGLGAAPLTRWLYHEIIIWNILHNTSPCATILLNFGDPPEGIARALPARAWNPQHCQYRLDPKDRDVTPQRSIRAHPFSGALFFAFPAGQREETSWYRLSERPKSCSRL